jgi:peptide subunit release factor RF-3
LRWIQTDLDDQALKLKIPSGGAMALDERGRRVMIFSNEWSMNYYREKKQIFSFRSPT